MTGNELLNSLLSRHEKEEQQLRVCLERWRGQHGGDTQALFDQFSSEVCSIGDEIYSLGLRELEVREEETRAFEGCVKRAQKEAQDNGIKLVRIVVISNVVSDDIFFRQTVVVVAAAYDSCKCLGSHFRWMTF